MVDSGVDFVPSATVYVNVRHDQKIKAHKTEYYAANAEKVKAAVAKYQAANREEIKAYQAAYRAAKKAEAVEATTRDNYD